MQRTDKSFDDAQDEIYKDRRGETLGSFVLRNRWIGAYTNVANVYQVLLGAGLQVQSETVYPVLCANCRFLREITALLS